MSFGGTDDPCGLMRYSDKKVRWFLDARDFSNSYGRRSVSFFKSSMSIGVRRVAAKSGDFFFPLGLCSAAINSLKNIITVLVPLPKTKKMLENS